MMTGAQATARTVLHGGVDGGGSQGGNSPDATRATAGGDDVGLRAHCVAEGPSRGSDDEGPGD